MNNAGPNLRAVTHARSLTKHACASTHQAPCARSLWAPRFLMVATHDLNMYNLMRGFLGSAVPTSALRAATDWIPVLRNPRLVLGPDYQPGANCPQGGLGDWVGGLG